MSSRAPGFTGSTIDRADHLRLDEERLRELAASRHARLMRLTGLDPDLDEGGRIAWSSMAEAEEEMIFLGLQDETPLFAPLRRMEGAGSGAFASFRMLGIMAPEEAALWGAARSLIHWHNRHGFCANCGSPTRFFRAGWGRKCNACGTDHFPRVDPVVIMLAEYGGKVLLGRQPQYPPGRYSALAGFVEPGESIEEAVAREIREEAGLDATNVRYIASQPWPFPGSLMIACIAAAGTEEIRLDTNELEDAIWVDRKGVADALSGNADAPFTPPPPFAIAHTLLAYWLEAEPLAASASAA